jgi:membrane protein DedA with SNARE-associated domain
MLGVAPIHHSVVEFVTLLVLAGLFVAGYETRSYVGAFVPGTLVVFALYAYLNSTPSGDEVDVLPMAFLVSTIVGVLVYLAGVALGRRARRARTDAA